MSFMKTIKLLVDDETVVNINVEFTEHFSQPDLFRVVIKGPSGKNEAEATWHVFEEDGHFSLQITSQNVASGICLAGCLAGIVTSAGPLVDCLKKAKDRNEVRSCINQHGIFQTIVSLSCIYGCLNI